jgi:hypothetical protein
MRNQLHSLLLFVWAASALLPGPKTNGAATIQQQCSSVSPGATTVTFSWPQARGAYQLWLDLSQYNDGFAPGSFLGVGPLGPNDTSYTWEGIYPDTPYYFRVHALYADGWRVLKTGSFVSGQCGGQPAAMQWVTQQCSATVPGKVQASFSWSPSLLPKSVQWLDLSLFDTSFAPNTFVSAGPLAAGESAYTWDGLDPTATHYWRVNTLATDGWHASPMWSFGTLTCPTQSAFGVAANPDLQGLRDRLAAAIDDSRINAAVAVTDLQTGESIDVKGDDTRHAGCTANWFVLLSNVIDLQAGLYPESDVGDLIARTIYGSNPITARVLLIKTGGSVPGGVFKINDLLARLGLRNTVYDHPPAFADEFSLQGWPNVITANDANRALASFYHGAIVNYQWRDYLLEKMTGVKPGLQYLIPAGVGNGRVSHKNGFSWVAGGWIDNDIGIVTFDSSGGPRAYAISFYSQDVSVQYADIPVGQRVSGMVWQYFRNRYP